MIVSIRCDAIDTVCFVNGMKCIGESFFPTRIAHLKLCEKQKIFLIRMAVCGRAGKKNILAHCIDVIGLLINGGINTNYANE